MKRLDQIVVLMMGLAGVAAGAAETHARATSAKAARLDAVLDPLMEKAVADGNMPGGVLLVGHDGRVVYRKAFGMRSLEPAREPMTVGTIFDLASLTKCVATTTAVMQLFEEGRVRLNDPVAAYLPEFAQNGKQDVTVRELMTHYSGLAPDLDLSTPWNGRDAAFKMAMEQKPAHPPGSRFEYSDINFEVLGFLVERVTGEPLNEYAARHVFAPLGMGHTRFLPPEEWKARIAPTQYDVDGAMLRGLVHDPTARRMGGVAGHAGLFSTADDLARFAQALLSGEKVLHRETVEKMTTPQQAANAASERGLGWDIDSPFASNRGELLPVGSFGHTGFTGTSLWIDPVTDTYIVLLTNAVHPRGGKSVVSLRARVATAVAQGLRLTVREQERLRLARITGYNESLMASRRMQHRNGAVKLGIDVLEEHGFRELHADAAQPVKVGLVTNQTGVDGQGRTDGGCAGACGGRAADGDLQPGARDYGERGYDRDPGDARCGDGCAGVQRVWQHGCEAAARSGGVGGTGCAGVRYCRMRACIFIPTRARWDILWRLRRRQARRWWCWTGRIRSTAYLCRGRWRTRGGRALWATGRPRCGTA